MNRWREPSMFARSCPILAVDSDVLGAQVAGPDRWPPRRRTRGSRRSGSSLPLRCSRRKRRGIVMRQAVLEQQRAAHADGELLDVEGDARASGGRDDASPVRIGAVDRGLHERGVGDRPAPPVARRLIVRAPETVTAMSFVAPSPPRTIATASSRETASIPSSRAG